MRILIAGDYCPFYRVADLIEKGNHSVVFNEIHTLLDSYDYSIVNLECPVATGCKPIEKFGPNLRCTEKVIDSLKYAGFNAVTLANNHFYDFGDEGVQSTINALSLNSIDYVGGGMNYTQASKSLIKRLGNARIAFINCCEHEFSIATNNSGGANPLNPISQYYSIQKAKQDADFVVVIVHGGNEFYQLPSPRMQDTYRFFVDIGADAVINHHQHCVSGFEVYQGKPIFYGIGNFCFDDAKERDSVYNYGFLVGLDFSCPDTGYKIIPYQQCNESPVVSLLNGENLDSFMRQIAELNSIIKDRHKLESEYQQFLSTDRLGYSLLFEPYSHRYPVALYRRHLLPSFINKQKRLKALNFLMCESRIEQVINALKNHTNE